MKQIIQIALILFTIQGYSQSSEELFTVSGTVNSGLSGNPLNQCNLNFINTNGKRYWGNTDSLGNYTIYELKAGTYKVEVFNFGYNNLDTTVVIDPSSPLIFNFELNADCTYNKERAKVDLKKGKAKLLLAGGIAPIGNSPSDKEFEKKYNVEYYDFGCEIENYECMAEYNRTIMAYLNKQYGIGWRVSARNDIIMK